MALSGAVASILTPTGVRARAFARDLWPEKEVLCGFRGEPSPQMGGRKAHEAAAVGWHQMPVKAEEDTHEITSVLVPDPVL
jgi:hypothetical protein